MRTGVIHFGNDIYEMDDSDKAWVAETNVALDRLRSFRGTAVRAADYPGLASAALAAFRQVWLFRAVSLAESACSEWNARRPLGAVVLMRALVETIASFHHVMDHGHVALQSGDLRSFHDRVMKGMFGSRAWPDDFTDMPESTNALTLVDRLDKTFKGMRGHYDALCEIVHPNAGGTLVFGTPEPDVPNWTFSEFEPAMSDVVAALIPPLGLLQFAAVAYEGSESRIMPIVRELEAKHGPRPTDWPSGAA